MDLHQIKIAIQDHFSDGLITIVGSGLSCAEGLPGMKELGEHLMSSVSPGLSADDGQIWNDLAPRIGEIGLEAALTEKLPSEALQRRIVNQAGSFIATREESVLREVILGSKTLRLTKLLKNYVRSSQPIAIVTTNYDRLVEVAAEEAGLGVDTLFVGNYAGVLSQDSSHFQFCRKIVTKGKTARLDYSPRVSVFKPHGSLDWYDRGGLPIRYGASLDGNRMIITPGLNKYRSGYESPFDLHRERANRVIDRSAKILVIGYGFNDDHLETHLYKKITSGTPTLIASQSLTPNAKSVVERSPNVMALVSDGASGTLLLTVNQSIQIPGMLWDIGSLVDEVF
ncbi:MAG: SIR2 family protein [Salinarimonas sp.]